MKLLAFGLVVVLMAGCVQPPTPAPAAGEGDLLTLVVERLDEIEDRLSNLEGKRPAPSPGPGPALHGLAETARAGWNDYTGSQVQVLLGVAADIRAKKITTKSEMLDALNDRARSGRAQAMREVSKAFFVVPIGEEAAQTLEEAAKGIAWHHNR